MDSVLVANVAAYIVTVAGIILIVICSAILIAVPALSASSTRIRKSFAKRRSKIRDRKWLDDNTDRLLKTAQELWDGGWTDDAIKLLEKMENNVTAKSILANIKKHNRFDLS